MTAARDPDTRSNTVTDRQRRHLRDASKICPEIVKLSNGLVINRCERDAGHDGQHKDFCTHWGTPTAEAQR